MNKMKKMRWILAMGLVCGAVAFTACSSDSSSSTDPDEISIDESSIAEHIVGKWIVVEKNGEPVLTNEKVVTTFESTTKGYVSASISVDAGPGPAPDSSKGPKPEEGPKPDSLMGPKPDSLKGPQPGGGVWNNAVEFKAKIEGDKVRLTEYKDGKASVVKVYTIISITDDELVAKHEMIVEGRDSVGMAPPEGAPEGAKDSVERKAPGEEEVRMVKLTEDYSKDVLGTWEGKISSEQDAYSDDLTHRWEYKKNGTYVYYFKKDGKWVASDNTLNEYFVDGTLLCSRWISEGKEYREWWDVESIKDGKMKWTALRKDDDGKTYTASFEMSKVNTK